jgi:hypothetical protein
VLKQSFDSERSRLKGRKRRKEKRGGGHERCMVRMAGLYEQPRSTVLAIPDLPPLPLEDEDPAMPCSARIRKGRRRRLNSVRLVDEGRPSTALLWLILR